MIQSAKWLTTVALSMATVGCSSSPASPDGSSVTQTLRAEPVQTVYSPGDTVRIVFRNAGATDIYVNPCGSILERLAAGDWMSIPADPMAPNCGETSHLIHPGETWTASVGALENPLGPGTYRYRIRFFALPAPNGGIEVFPFALATSGFLVGS